MKSYHLILLIVVSLLAAGCSGGTSLQLGDRIVGIQSGQFVYKKGTLTTEYSGAPFEKVLTACEKTLNDLKATNVVIQKKISSATLSGEMEEEEVRITVDYVAKDITNVSVRVGTAGSNLASQFVQEKIKTNLSAL